MYFGLKVEFAYAQGEGNILDENVFQLKRDAQLDATCFCTIQIILKFVGTMCVMQAGFPQKKFLFWAWSKLYAGIFPVQDVWPEYNGNSICLDYFLNRKCTCTNRKKKIRTRQM